MIEEESSKPSSVNEDDYQVGYKRPPKAHQFKKGQSGNPRGRKKGSKGYDTLMREQLTQKIKVSVGGKVKVVAFAEALIMSLKRRALEGDRAAIAQLIPLIQRYALLEADEEPWDLSVLDDDEFEEFERLLGKISVMGENKPESQSDNNTNSM
jgi:hypothetical protein